MEEFLYKFSLVFLYKYIFILNNTDGFSEYVVVKRA